MKRFFFFIVPLLIFTACSGGNGGEQAEAVTDSEHLQITQDQFNANNMKLGSPTTHNFENIVECNGYITAPPNGMANISTQIGGIVKSIKLSPGDYVKKGETLCELTSNEFIGMQQSLVESSAKLKQLRLDYKRSKTLYEEKIGSEKDFIAVESAFKAMQAKYKAIKMQLQLLGLNVKKIEKNEFYLTFPIYAPISGQISDININLGQYVEQQQQIMEIVNESTLQLNISVFEESINYLKPGQAVKFFTINNASNVYNATLKTIGNSINPDTKTIICIATINSEQERGFVNNSFVKVNIITEEQEATAIPSEALMKSGDRYFVLSLEKSENSTYFFKKREVKTGRKSKHFTEIVEADIPGEILVNGVYNLSAE